MLFHKPAQHAWMVAKREHDTMSSILGWTVAARQDKGVLEKVTRDMMLDQY